MYAKSVRRSQLFRPGTLREQLFNLVGRDGNTVANYQPGNYTGTLNASAWLNSIGAASSLAQATGANQPIVLPWSGTNYLWLPGVGGNYVSTPDAAANRITGDIAVVGYGACNAWGSGIQNAVAGKNGLTDYAVFFGIDGTLHIYVNANGGNSTVPLGLTDGVASWFAVTRVASSGVAKTYISTDGISWTLKDTSATIAGNIPTSASALYVGTRGDTSTEPWLGKQFRVKLFNGIPPMLGGAASANPVVDWNAADWPETSTNGATQASSTTGEVWTLNNTGAKPAQIVGSPSLLFDGTAHTMAMATTLIQPETIYMVGRQVSWTSTEAIFDGAALASGELIQTTATPQLNITAGSSVAANTNLAVGTYGVITAVFNGASSSLQIDGNVATTGNAGAANMSGFTLGANGDDLLFGNIQVKEVIIRSTADSAATQAAIQSLLKALHGTP